MVLREEWATSPHLCDGRYWRAPRPRPKPHRRKRRKEKKTILQAALHKDSAAAVHSNAEEVIFVLQQSLRKALSVDKNKKAEQVTEKLKMAKAKLRRAERKHQDTQIKTQKQHAAELSSRDKKLDDAQRKIRKLQEKLNAYSENKSRIQKGKQVSKAPRKQGSEQAKEAPRHLWQLEDPARWSQRTPKDNFEYAARMSSSERLHIDGTWQDVCYYKAMVFWYGSSRYDLLFCGSASIILVFILTTFVYHYFWQLIVALGVYVAFCACYTTAYTL